MSDDYGDRWIRCTPDAIEIRGYYFPWGTKRIAYGSIRSLRRVEVGAFTGRGRIWGTANFRYWANLDPSRPRKKVGLILDVGRRVHPFLTPDDPHGFEAAVYDHTGLEPDTGGDRSSPLL
jgi:hypothetical protein